MQGVMWTLLATTDADDALQLMITYDDNQAMVDCDALDNDT